MTQYIVVLKSAFLLLILSIEVMARPIPSIEIDANLLEPVNQGSRFSVDFPYSPALILLYPDEGEKSLAEKLKKHKNAFRDAKDEAQRVKAAAGAIQLFIALSAFKRVQEEMANDQKLFYWNRNQRHSPKPVPSHPKSDAVLLNFDRFIDRSGFSKKEPLIRFSKAYIKYYIDLTPEVYKTFQELKKSKASKLGPLARIFAGEIAFKRGQDKESLKILGAVQKTQPQSLAYSLYRQATVHIRSGQSSKVTGMLVKSLKLTRKQGHLQVFNDRVQRLLTLNLFRISNGRGVLNQNSVLNLGPSFIKQAEQVFADFGSFGNALQMNKFLAQDASLAEEFPTLYTRRLQYLFQLKRYGDLWKNIGDFEMRYGSKSSWRQTHSDHPFLSKNIESLLYQYAQAIHKTAQKTSDLELGALAAEGYKLYLSLYPQSPKLQKVRYYLADTQMLGGFFDSATLLYKQLVALGSGQNFIFDSAIGGNVDLHYPASLRLALSMDYLIHDAVNLDEENRLVAEEGYVDGCLTLIENYPETLGVNAYCYKTSMSILQARRKGERLRRFLEEVASRASQSPLGAQALRTLLASSRSYGKAHQKRILRLSTHEKFQNATYQQILKNPENIYD